MATLTDAEAKSIFQKALILYEETRKFGGTAAKNVIGMQDDLNAVLKGDFVVEISERIASSRSRVDALIRDAGGALDVALRNFGQVLNVPEIDSQSLITRMYNDFIASNRAILSRGFVFGAPAAGTNQGNGVIVRLNVDENGFAIENQHADAKKATCIADATTGSEKWEEVFELRGQAASRDAIKLSGSGARASIAALSARASSGLLKNPSFSQSDPAGPTAVPTAITSWTASPAVSSGNGYELIGGTGANGFYRSFPGDATPLALRLKNATTYTLSQDLEVERAKLLPGVPYFVQVAWRRQASATGTLELKLGSKAVSVSIATGTNGVWNVLRLGPGTENWFKNFNQTVAAGGVLLKLTVTSLATGQVDLDDAIITPWASFDGAWYAIVGTPATGDPTQSLRDDTFSWSDTEYTTGINQSFLWRAFGRYWPARHAVPGSGVTLAQPSAGSIPNGTYQYKVTFVDANAVESGPNATATSITVAAGPKQVDVSAIPTGTATIVTKRKLYRTIAGGATFKLLTTLNDNSTVVFTDNTVDASLGADMTAAVTAGITFADPT